MSLIEYFYFNVQINGEYVCVEFGIAVFGSLGNGVVLVTVVVGDRKENRGEEVEGVGDWDKACRMASPDTC